MKTVNYLVVVATCVLAACGNASSADGKKLSDRQAAALQYTSTICVTWAGMGKIWNTPSDNRADIDAAVAGMRSANFDSPKLAYLEKLGQRISAQVQMTESWDRLTQGAEGKRTLEALCLKRVNINPDFNSAILLGE